MGAQDKGGSGRRQFPSPRPVPDISLKECVQGLSNNSYYRALLAHLENENLRMIDVLLKVTGADREAHSVEYLRGRIAGRNEMLGEMHIDG